MMNSQHYEPVLTPPIMREMAVALGALPTGMGELGPWFGPRGVDSTPHLGWAVPVARSITTQTYSLGPGLAHANIYPHL